MFDSLEAVLALLDNLVKNLLASIQIRMPDFVGMPRVELVALWHLLSNCFSRYRVDAKTQGCERTDLGPVGKILTYLSEPLPINLAGEAASVLAACI